MATASGAAEKARLWKVRKGLYTSVAGSRPSGTTALLEDICVPVDRLLPTCEGLTELFRTHAYDSSVIFGHARDGNLHFLVNERFSDPRSLERYDAVHQPTWSTWCWRTTATSRLSTARAGSWRRTWSGQYGTALYEVMRDIKRLVDPDLLLNPGVLLPLNGASGAVDLTTLKLPVTVESEVDRCVECGYCEPACPSKDLTLTPRQRITLRRDMNGLRAAGNTALADAWRRTTSTPASTRAPSTACAGSALPGLIYSNTGDLVRRLRREEANPVAAAGWDVAARAWGGVSKGGGLALSVADKVPGGLVSRITDVLRKVVSTDVMPRYDGGLPGGGPRRVPGRVGEGLAAAVYVPACIQTMFGPEEGDGVMGAFREVCERAGVTIEVPAGIGSMCCGTPWKSKGYAAGYERMSDRTLPALWDASGHGRVPIVVDAASCTEGFQVMLEHAAGVYPGLTIVDATTYVAHQVLPALTVKAALGSLAVHPTCSSAQIGSTADLLAICTAIADEVVVPLDAGCCAFAGDRGLLHPELHRVGHGQGGGGGRREGVRRVRQHQPHLRALRHDQSHRQAVPTRPGAPRGGHALDAGRSCRLPEEPVGEADRRLEGRRSDRGGTLREGDASDMECPC